MECACFITARLEYPTIKLPRKLPVSYISLNTLLQTSRLVHTVEVIEVKPYEDITQER